MRSRHWLAGMGLIIGLAACSKDESFENRTDAPTLYIESGSFSEATLLVPLGATVTWVNKDEETHGVVEESGRFHVLLDYGATFSYKFDSLGNYNYRCPKHPDQRASVLVVSR